MATEKDVPSFYCMLFYMLDMCICVCVCVCVSMVEKVCCFHGKVLHIPGYDKAITRLFLINKDSENITLSLICYFFNGNEIS